MSPAEIRTANAIIGLAMEQLFVTDDDRADAIMSKMLEAYEPCMTVDELLANI
jgi:hypothetical protein